MLLGQHGIDGLEKVVLFPSFQHDGWPLLAGEGAQFIAGIFRRNGFLQVALNGQVEPFLGALLDLEAHARGVAQDAQQTDRLVSETMNGERANLGPFDVGEAVSGIEQQAARGRVQDRKSTRLNSSHITISYAVFCLKKKKNKK